MIYEPVRHEPVRRAQLIDPALNPFTPRFLEIWANGRFFAVFFTTFGHISFFAVFFIAVFLHHENFCRLFFAVFFSVGHIFPFIFTVCIFNIAFSCKLYFFNFFKIFLAVFICRFFLPFFSVYLIFAVFILPFFLYFLYFAVFFCRLFWKKRQKMKKTAKKRPLGIG